MHVQYGQVSNQLEHGFVLRAALMQHFGTTQFEMIHHYFTKCDPNFLGSEKIATLIFEL